MSIRVSSLLNPAPPSLDDPADNDNDASDNDDALLHHIRSVFTPATLPDDAASDDTSEGASSPIQIRLIFEGHASQPEEREEEQSAVRRQPTSTLKKSPSTPQPHLNPRLLTSPAPLLAHPYKFKYPQIPHADRHPDPCSNPASELQIKKLHTAARNGLEIPLRELVDSGVPVYSREEDTLFTPLHQAAMRGYLGIVAFLLENGADPQAKNCQGQTPLHLAARHGMVSVIELLLDQGALIDATSYDGKTALHRAAKANSLETVRLLLDRGADVNALDAFFLTPIDVAAGRRESTQVVDYLLQKGADVKGDYVSKALHFSVRNGESLTVLVLLDHGAKLSQYCGWSVLRAAVASGSLSTVEILLTHGAGLEVRDSSGRTALHQAAVNGNVLMIQYLLEAGALAKTTDSNGNTAADLASIYGHKKACEILPKIEKETAPQSDRRPYWARDPAIGFVTPFRCEDFTTEDAFDKRITVGEARFLNSNVLDICMWRNLAEDYIFKATYCGSPAYRPWRDIQKAIQLWCDTLEFKTNTRGAFWATLGDLYRKAGFIDSAIKVFERIADEFDRWKGHSFSLFPEVHLEVGDAYLVRGDHEKAIKAHRKYLAAKNISQHDGWRRIGDAYMKMGKYEEAINAYRTALNKASSHHDMATWKLLADALEVAGMSWEAGRSYMEYRKWFN
ncbi:hypothetical protein FQN55_008095 [Onygenales sp. PD_40]|nr:hypothetical protein FQN55_008095 [Onygenales sp. PD_40]KAK2777724.1 hypothetical protein FQN52_003001 [Onygenales sp. PD_12]